MLLEVRWQCPGQRRFWWSVNSLDLSVGNMRTRTHDTRAFGFPQYSTLNCTFDCLESLILRGVERESYVTTQIACGRLAGQE